MSTAYEYLSEQNTSTNRSFRMGRLALEDKPGNVVTFPANPDAYKTVVETVDSDGMIVRGVSFADVSDTSPSREPIRNRIDNYVEQVRLHPEWQGPRVVVDEHGVKQLQCNPVSDEMYRSMPAMASWRKELVPGAVALYPLQYPDEKFLPNGIEIDELTRDMFTNSLDAIGIRTRAKVMSHLAADYINESGATNWTSLACGAAVPVLNAIEDNLHRINGINLKLVDFDPEALSFAGDLADSRQLLKGQDYDLLNRNLLKDLIATDRLVDELGEASMELVDALGIFEYFNEKTSVRFLKNAYRLVKPGGALVAANMLDTHPEILFNQRVIGWPTIYPRSISELKSIITAAGIDPGNVSMTIPSDGIYSVLEIKK